MYEGLVKSYLNFCQIRKESYKTGVIDLSNRNLFYPTTFLPLCDHIKKHKQTMGYIPPSDHTTCSYIDKIIHPSNHQCHKSKSRMHIINLPKNDTTTANKTLCNLYPAENEWIIVGGKSTYTCIINEIVDNIYQHSEFNNASAMAQKHDKEGFIELSFFDDGITISGSYEKHLGLEFDGTKAIMKAINGFSTKHEVGRGTGLYNSIKLVSEGMKGDVMIVSGDGMFYIKQSENHSYKLDHENNKLRGTLISIRIPFQKKEVLWYEYIK